MQAAPAELQQGFHERAIRAVRWSALTSTRFSGIPSQRVEVDAFHLLLACSWCGVLMLGTITAVIDRRYSWPEGFAVSGFAVSGAGGGPGSCGP